MRIFQRGADPRRILSREDAREKFLLRATQVMQEGLYVTPGGELKSDEVTIEKLRQRLPAQHCVPIPGAILAEAGSSWLNRIQGGELITAAEVSGLYPKPVVEEYREDRIPVDDQYLSIFRVVPSDSASEQYRKNSFTVNFEKTDEGEEPKLQTYDAELSTLANETYEALVGYKDTWLSDGALNLIEEMTQAVREGAADKRATYFYAKIEALAATETAYASNWIVSLNGAIARLRRAKRLAPNQTPIVMAPVELAGDLLQAVKDSLVTGVRGTRLTQIPDLLFTSYMLSTAKVKVLPPKSALSPFVDQEREALNAANDAPGALRISKTGWRMRFAGWCRDTSAMEEITQP